MEVTASNSKWRENDAACDCILVTGGTGLIGRSVRDILSMEGDGDPEYCIRPTEKWVFLSSKDGDLRDLNAVNGIFQKYKPTKVLHLAAKVGGLYTNMANNLEFFRDNMIINDNVLHTSYESGVKKVVSCLSTCIFPDKTTYPIDESMLHNGPPHSSNFGYSYAKRMIDVQNQAYNQKLKTQGREGLFTSIIPCNIFGPWDNFDLAESHVIPGLIHKMYLANQRGDTDYTIFGTGSALRQFIYSKDLAKLIIGIMRDYNEQEPIILSVDEADEVPIKVVAEMIASNFQHIKEIKTDPTQSDGQYKKTANNSKLRRLFPTFRFTPLAQAIEESVDWFIRSYGTENGLRLGSSK